MVLCEYTVRITIPDDWPPRVAFSALDAVDEAQIQKTITDHLNGVLNTMPETRGATATVED